MTELPITGAILAAGKGSRMAPFSQSFPKPMLPICNKPLIQHQVEIMSSLGIRDIVILVGHRGFEISKALGSGAALGVNIRYVEQSSYLGIAHAVGCLESYIHSPFLLFLGDIFFRRGRLESMLHQLKDLPGGAVLAVKQENDPEAMRKNYAVVLDSAGSVTRVIEKPRIAPSRLKGVGIYLFDLTIFDAIRRTPRTAMRDEYEITHSIQVLIDDGYPVRSSPSVDEDVNLTFPVDLLRCNLEEAGLANGGNLLGDNIWIHPEAHISHSIIGNNVRIEQAVHLSNSLVFQDTQLKLSGEVNSHIITPEGMVDCSVGNIR